MGTSSSVVINEIMYNPEGNDAGREWVEFYNNGSDSVDIEGWKFFESGKHHELSLINGSYIIGAGNYAIIAEDWALFLSDYGFNGTLLDSSWPSLGNSGEFIAIKNSSFYIVDWVNYSPDYGGGNGKSIVRSASGWSESTEDGGSPGKENNISKIQQQPDKGLKLEVFLDKTAYVGIEYTALFKVQNLNHVSGIEDDINLTIGYNIAFNKSAVNHGTVFIEALNSFKTSSTGFFLPIEEGNYEITGWIVNSTIEDADLSDDADYKLINVIDANSIPCNITLDISIGEKIYENLESIKFHNKLNDESYPYTIEYWIEDLFGAVFKGKLNTTNTNQKTWKTDIKESDRVLFIKSRVFPKCNDANTSDNSAEKMFIVRSDLKNSNKKEESVLEILGVDEDIKFGDVIGVKVKLYKGNTNKYAVSLRAEKNGKKVSKTTKMRLYGKYSSYDVEIPLKLDSNCNRKLEKGNYDLVVSGLGTVGRKKIEINENAELCQKTSSSANSNNSKSNDKKFNFELKEFDDAVNAGADYKVKITFDNDGDKDMGIEVWSYIYRGSKSYTGGREDNKKGFVLKANSAQEVELINPVDEAAPGDYKLKVLVNKDGQKTNKEIIKNITIRGQKLEDSVSELGMSDRNIGQKDLASQMTGNAIVNEETIYESNNEKAKSLILMMILVLSLIINVVLIVSR
jgi:hypothetical protein